jgi:hypothetical protein
VFTKLLDLQYKIVYKKGVENRGADALSRMPVTNDSAIVNCFALSACQPKWLDDILATYSDDYSKELLVKLTVDPSVVLDFTLKGGVLRYKSRVWVGDDQEFRLKLITTCHSSALGGHSSIPVTYRRMKKLFAWRGMKKDVTQFISACVVCQMAKPDRIKSLVLLQPVDIPKGAWQTVSLDFVTGLLQSENADYILVVVDEFTKFAHFLPLKHPYTAFLVAKVFLYHVYKLHGLLTAIISDRDTIFTSNFWRELFQLAQVQLCMSSSYHAQSDGRLKESTNVWKLP